MRQLREAALPLPSPSTEKPCWVFVPCSGSKSLLSDMTLHTASCKQHKKLVLESFPATKLPTYKEVNMKVHSGLPEKTSPESSWNFAALLIYYFPSCILSQQYQINSCLFLLSFPLDWKGTTLAQLGNTTLVKVLISLWSPLLLPSLSTSVKGSLSQPSSSTAGWTSRWP